MKTKNQAKEVSKQIDQLLTRRNKELSMLWSKQEEIQARIESAQKTMQESIASLDMDAYETAKQDESRAKTSREVYAERIRQIQTEPYISDAESDAVIKSLERYEADMEQEFEEQAAEHVKALAELYADYTGAVAETEQTIRDWTQKIHDERIRHTRVYNPYDGCVEAAKLQDYLRRTDLFTGDVRKIRDRYVGIRRM